MDNLKYFILIYFCVIYFFNDVDTTNTENDTIRTRNKKVFIIINYMENFI